MHALESVTPFINWPKKRMLQTHTGNHNLTTVSIKQPLLQQKQNHNDIKKITLH